MISKKEIEKQRTIMEPFEAEKRSRDKSYNENQKEIPQEVINYIT